MSQKAWMQAYTKGSKSLQARLEKIHANNPEFQNFVKKHGFGSNLSVKQSGLHKKSVVTVKPVDQPHPESKKGPQDREAMIKTAAEKLRARRQANANRVAFGGELGGGFSMPLSGFRRYTESVKTDEALEDDIHWTHTMRDEFVKVHAPEHKNVHGKKARVFHKFDDGRVNVQVRMGTRKGKEIVNNYTLQPGQFKKVAEDVAYRDGEIGMRKGGWIAKRDGKQIGIVMSTKRDATDMLDSTRRSLAQKTIDVLKKKKYEIARGLGRFSMATESAENRARVRSWDSAILPDFPPLTVKPVKNDLPFTPDKPKKNLGIVVGKNNPGYSRARHLARLGLKKAMEQSK